MEDIVAELVLVPLPQFRRSGRLAVGQDQSEEDPQRRSGVRRGSVVETPMPLVVAVGEASSSASADESLVHCALVGAQVGKRRRALDVREEDAHEERFPIGGRDRVHASDHVTGEVVGRQLETGTTTGVAPSCAASTPCPR